MSDSSLIQTLVDASDLAGALRRGQRFEMGLQNHGNMAYTGSIALAGQTLSGLFDTGSADLVAFERGCSGCGGDAVLSCEEPACAKTGIKGELEYGSGKVSVEKAIAEASVGPLKVSSMSLLVAYHAALTGTEDLQAIVGMSRQGTLAKGLGLQSFSFCLPQGGSGKMVLNDNIGGGFSTAGISNNFFWGSSLSGAKLVGDLGTLDLGGAFTILDTGTSVIGLPGPTIQKIEDHLNSLDYSCVASELPSLKFSFGGAKFELPPAAYLAQIGRDCVILLTDTSDLDNAWILGMPFFAYYYTNFDLGSGKVHAAPTGGGCTPHRMSANASSELMTVDPRKVILPKGGSFYSYDNASAHKRRKGRFRVMTAPTS